MVAEIITEGRIQISFKEIRKVMERLSKDYGEQLTEKDVNRVGWSKEGLKKRRVHGEKQRGMGWRKVV